MAFVFRLISSVLFWRSIFRAVAGIVRAVSRRRTNAPVVRPTPTRLRR
jgi:hypothetical protein